MRRRWKLLIALAILLAVLIGSATWFLNSGWIENYVTQRAQAEVEKAMGAKLTFGKLRFDYLRGRVIIESVVARGNEPATGQPLFTARQIQLDIGFSALSQSRVDLRAVSVLDPKLFIIAYPNGTTNIPGPAVKIPGPRPLEHLVNWRLGRVTLQKGELKWNEIRTPFEVDATGVQASMDYLAPSRTYRGTLTTADLTYRHAALPPINGNANVDFAITSEQVRLEKAVFRSGPVTVIQARGSLVNVENQEDPFRADLDVEATLAPGHILQFIKLPAEPTGIVTYTGKLLFEANRGFELHGDATGRDLYYRDGASRLGPIKATSKIDFLPARLTMTKLRAEAFGGELDGDYLWDLQEGWRFDGDIAKLSIATLLKQMNAKSVPWSGQIHGPIEAQGGKQPLILTADLEIEASQGPSPLTGLLALTYEESGNRLLARNSFLALPHSRLNFAGDLAKGIALEFNSTAFRELLPVLELAHIEEKSLPISLQRGTATINGQLTGTTSAPRFRGVVEATNLLAASRDIDHIKANVGYGDELLTLDQLDLEALGGTLKGNLRAVLDEGALQDGSLLSGRLEAHLSDIGRLPLPEPIRGSLDATFTLRGTWAEPAVDGNLRAPSLEARDLKFQQTAAAFSASRREVRIAEWETRLDSRPLRGVLNLKAGGNDWKIGVGNGSVKIDALPLMSIPVFRQEGISGNALLNTDTQVDFTWSPEGVAPSKIDGKLSLASITRYGRPVGQLEFTSRTTGQRAALTVNGSIRQLPIKGDATIQFGTRLDTELRLQLPRLDFPTVAQLLSEQILPSPLPYEGSAEASFFFKGPLLDPQGWDGRLTIPQIQLSPNKDYVRESMPTVSDFVLRNEGPVVVELRRGFIGARDVRFVAKDTNLTTSFQYRANTKGLTGAAKGTINLAVLSTLKPDLVAKGAALLDASLQGTTDDPQLNGRLSFQNASFYLRDVITGLDKVNGAILFDKNRATIESLKAQAGGGDLQLTGFVGFGKQISYRLQAQASQVRLRYPEGVSTSANGTLALTGTTDQSILTGHVSILRSNIGQVDTAQLILGSQNIAGESPANANEFLRNLQFDIRIDAAQNVEFSTAFTKDVKGEVNLRLRGSPQRPIVLGRIAVTQGDIDFFGARYQISRGEVNFTNPLRIEPVIALDLETRVRGVVISISFNGPASKLNMSYRSDPPLQSNEILALLTVGRNPGATSSIAQQGPIGQTQGLFGNDSSVILGAAVTAGINGRLQRFFGISRVRLDPQLTGIDNVPQARLTLEQQVSRDVTLTYITNLNRTQQQIVRLDWDISKAWSVVAVRDENGIFGVDLFFRKRLK